MQSSPASASNTPSQRPCPGDPQAAELTLSPGSAGTEGMTCGPGRPPQQSCQVANQRYDTFLNSTACNMRQMPYSTENFRLQLQLRIPFRSPKTRTGPHAARTGPHAARTGPHAARTGPHAASNVTSCLTGLKIIYKTLFPKLLHSRIDGALRSLF